MFEIAQQLEQRAASAGAEVQIGAGLTVVLVGLFLWLGGLGLRRLLAGAAGAVGGGIFGLLIAENLVEIGIMAVAGAFVAVIFERAFITLLTAAFAAAIGFVVLAEVHKIDFTEGLKQACRAMPVSGWVTTAFLAVVCIVAGFYIWRFVSALCCAVLGTLLVFGGMIFLLLYKGAEPVKMISNRASWYAMVFVAMAAFGTVVQMLLWGDLGKSPGKKEQQADTEKPEERGRNWRSQ